MSASPREMEAWCQQVRSWWVDNGLTMSTSKDYPKEVYTDAFIFLREFIHFYYEEANDE